MLAYASDLAALTAACVAVQLGPPGDPLEAVRRTQDKLLLREAQGDAGLPTPAFVDASDESALSDLAARSAAGVAIKPTDASGSKGVTLLPPEARAEDMAQAVEQALAASRSRRAIAEEVWGVGTLQFGGDVLVWEGELRFASFGDQVMSPVPGSRINIGVLCPTSAPVDAVDEARRQVGSLVAALGLRHGAYNVEFRTAEDGRLTIIDLGARIGGNLLGIVHLLATGVDLVTATILMALGELPPVPATPRESRHAGHLVLHSQIAGVLESIDLSEELRSIAQDIVIAAKPGDAVRPYRTSADRLGVLVMASDDRSLLESVYRHAPNFLSVALR